MEKESVGAYKARPGHERELCRASHMLVFLWEAGRSWIWEGVFGCILYTGLIKVLLLGWMVPSEGQFL